MVAESELNRQQLEGDLAALKTEVSLLANRAKSLGMIMSSAVALTAGLAATRPGAPSPAAGKPSRVRTILKVAGLLSTFWLAWRSQSRAQPDR